MRAQEKDPASRRGRKELPAEERQSEMVRERVKPGVYQDYLCLGGKPFLLAAIEERKKDIRPGKKVMASCMAVIEDREVLLAQLDVTPYILALGEEEAMRIVDGDERAQSILVTDLFALPRAVKQFKGPRLVRVQDSIRQYFSVSPENQPPIDLSARHQLLKLSASMAQGLTVSALEDISRLGDVDQFMVSEIKTKLEKVASLLRSAEENLEPLA